MVHISHSAQYHWLTVQSDLSQHIKCDSRWFPPHAVPVLLALLVTKPARHILSPMFLPHLPSSVLSAFLRYSTTSSVIGYASIDRAECINTCFRHLKTT